MNETLKHVDCRSKAPSLWGSGNIPLGTPIRISSSLSFPRVVIGELSMVNSQRDCSMD